MWSDVISETLLWILREVSTKRTWYFENTITRDALFKVWPDKSGLSWLNWTGVIDADRKWRDLSVGWDAYRHSRYRGEKYNSVFEMWTPCFGSLSLVWLKRRLRPPIRHLLAQRLGSLLAGTLGSEKSGFGCGLQSTMSFGSRWARNVEYC
jgi:hypothetical protein